MYNIIVMTKQQIELEIDNLAAQVIPSTQIESFHSLPLIEKIFGLKVFAAIGADETAIAKLDRAAGLLMAVVA